MNKIIAFLLTLLVLPAVCVTPAAAQVSVGADGATAPSEKAQVPKGNVEKKAVVRQNHRAAGQGNVATTKRNAHVEKENVTTKSAHQEPVESSHPTATHPAK